MSNVAEFKPDYLIAGAFPLVTHTVTIAASQSLKRGAVLGRITAADKYTLSQPTSKDGSEQPSAILCDDVDSTGGDKQAVVYLAGQFNKAALSFGNGHTPATVFHALRTHNIYLTDVI